MRTPVTWLSEYSMVLVALGLGLSMHQRGEHLGAMVSSEPIQQVTPIVQPAESQSCNVPETKKML